MGGAKGNAHLPQELQDAHVIFTQRFAGLASPNNVTDESRPISGPILFDDLYQDHIELAQVHSVLL